MVMERGMNDDVAVAASSMKENKNVSYTNFPLRPRQSFVQSFTTEWTRALGPFSIIFFATHFLLSSSAALNIETLLSPYGVRWSVKAAAAVHRCFSLFLSLLLSNKVLENDGNLWMKRYIDQHEQSITAVRWWWWLLSDQISCTFTHSDMRSRERPQADRRVRETSCSYF